MAGNSLLSLKCSAGNFDVDLHCIKTHVSTNNLEDGDAGLVLQWRQKNKPPRRMLLSKHANCATLSASSLPRLLHSSLFGLNSMAGLPPAEDAHITHEEAHEVAVVLAATNTGELLAVQLTEADASMMTLGRTEQQVVWLGVVRVGAGDHRVCAVHCSGDALLLDHHNHSLPHHTPGHTKLWAAFSLDSYVVCCCAVDDCLVTSDGRSVQLNTVTSARVKGGKEMGRVSLEGCQCCLCSEDVTVLKRKVGFCGVVAVVYENELLTLRTVDGRLYSYTWSQFLNETASINEKGSRAESENIIYEKICNIEQIMKNLQRVDKLNSDIKKSSGRIDQYIEQLNMAQNLFFSNKHSDTVFTPRHSSLRNVDSSFFKMTSKVHFSSSQEYRFEVHVTLRCCLPCVVFAPEWWWLRVTVPTDGTERHVTCKLEDSVIVIGLTQREVEKLVISLGGEAKENNSCLKCSVIFSDFHNAEPVLCVEVTREHFGVFQFMSDKKMVLPCVIWTKSFSQIMCNLGLQNNDKSESKSSVNRKLSLTYPWSALILPELKKLFQVSDNPIAESKGDMPYFSVNKQFWFCDDCITVRATAQEGKNVQVALNSTSVSLLVAVRREIDSCVMKTTLHRSNTVGSKPSHAKPDTSDKSTCTAHDGNVTLSGDVMRDIFDTQRLLEAASACSDAPVVARTLYEHLSCLISRLPS